VLGIRIFPQPNALELRTIDYLTNPAIIDVAIARSMWSELRKLSLPASDLYLLGDGSGTTADKPCGWSVFMFIELTQVVINLGGSTTHGTNNFAELMPYVHALWLYENSRPPGRETRVCIVSDSEVTVRCGNRVYGRKANAALWAAIDWFEASGYRLTWRHVPRNSNSLNAAADGAAGRFRVMTAKTILEERERTHE
jgi:ribonuclease HI